MKTSAARHEFLYRDRRDAGRVLAKNLLGYHDIPGLIVLGLPRGGVPVAAEVASALHAPLDTFIVRKLGMPGQEELAMGAVASNGTVVFNDEVVRGVPRDLVEKVLEREQVELKTREEKYRRGRPPLELKDRFVILVDDGLATGASMKAAVKALKESSPAEITVAVPVAPSETCLALEEVADRVVCAATPPRFGGVGMWYEDFTQTSDEEVLALLEENRLRPTQRGPIPELDGDA